MISIKTYQTEKLNSSNINDAYELFTDAFGPKLSKDAFIKKYNTVHAGCNHVAYLAYRNKQAIGFYGCLPSKFYCKNTIFLAAQTCDSITHKEFQGQGIHFELANKTYEELKNHNATFVFALHSEATFQATKKLDWKIANSMSRFHIETGTKFLNKILPSSFLEKQKGIFINEIKQFETNKTLLQNPLNKEPGISYYYHKEYLQYKSFEPNFAIELNGCKFWLKLKANLEVGMVDFTDAQQLYLAIEKLKQLCKKYFIKEILLHATDDTQLERALSVKYNKQPSWRIGYKNLGCEFPLNTLLLNPADLDTF